MPTPPPVLTVCHVTGHFHPVLAGASERFRRYAPGLRERGIELVVITSRSHPELPEYEVLDGCIRVHRVEATCPDNGEFGLPLLVRAARQLLLGGAVRANIVQTVGASMAVTNDLWRLRASGHGLVHVGTMVGPEEVARGLARRIKARLGFALSLLPFHQLVVSTTRMARWNAQMGAIGRRMTVIPNGVDTERFHPASTADEKQTLRAQLGLPPTGPIVLFVGGLLPRKGLHVLLEAWPAVVRAHPTACLVVVGPTDRPTVVDSSKRAALDEYQVELRKLAHQCPEESVMFVGERSDVEQYYRAADVFVLPSEQEGMGNVVLEAFASGLPCLLTNYVGLPTEEFGQMGREFLCVSRQPEALSAALIPLMSSRNNLEEMASRALCWAEQHMSLHRTLDLYGKLYRGLGPQNA